MYNLVIKSCEKKAKLILKMIQRVYRYFGMISDICICLCPIFGCLDNKTRTKQIFKVLKGSGDR